MTENYTIPEAAEILGIEIGRLREWVSRGYINPVSPSKGRGSKNYLNILNLYQAKLFEYLIERGFNRLSARQSVRALFDRLTTKILNKPGDHLLAAFFRRTAANMTMVRKDIVGPFITPEGKMVSDKGLSPGVRIIHDADIEKSFSTLFIKFDDDESSRKYDYSKIDFEDILIVNLKKIQNEVDNRI